jgi:hypothetical protein
MIVSDDGSAEMIARLANWQRKKLVVSDGLLANAKQMNNVRRKSERLDERNDVCAKKRRGRRREIEKGRGRKTYRERRNARDAGPMQNPLTMKPPNDSVDVRQGVPPKLLPRRRKPIAGRESSAGATLSLR